ncbi:MAG: hypothetical protein KDA44_17860 [Planctomycetales bacterium]|nr:hypothetical protein [Planctomycetales bacterium]
MRLLLLALAFASGCSVPPPNCGPATITEGFPATVSIVIDNPGRQPLQVTRVTSIISQHHLLVARGAGMPAEFSDACVVTQGDVAAGGKSTVEFEWVWKSPPNSPAALAVVEASFRIEFSSGAVDTTGINAAVLESQPDVFAMTIANRNESATVRRRVIGLTEEISGSSDRLDEIRLWASGKLPADNTK